MLTIGVDAHKRVHEAVALDAAGREVGRRRVPNSAGRLAGAARLGGGAGRGGRRPGGGGSRGPGATGAGWPSTWWRRARRSSR